ncbi:hypothetical protein C1I98_06115 [Spongiactinospora gelatinilytica]|uniref:DUF3168 domain-containing protein n=1 Tax=Spongiactinospora gelatinilytica TaxID=2666298 RepID=A0A2W2HDV0_9ACTN|nr:hypothetical protein [Spongiactinospora gelatinilytica]PZG53129.1 hypothetical protein C1I98_06115 [Spongiactinospora gelatinilytica]
MEPTVSTVPACLRALVAAAERAVPPRVVRGREVPVTVVLGQPNVGQMDSDEMVLIAFTGEPGDAAVTSTRTQRQATPAPDRESYDVTCLATSWHGHDDEPLPVLDRTYEMVNALAAELAADGTLGGVVGRTRISTDQLVQVQTDHGATAVLRFTVHVEAFTRPF